MRRLCLFILVLALVLVLAGCQSPTPPHATVSGGAFHDGFGVNTHQHFANSAYANWTQVLADLHGLGIRNIRDVVYDNAIYPVSQWDQAEDAAFKAAVAQGVKIDFILDPRNCLNQDPQDCLNVIANREGIGSAVKAIEWPNEYDNSGDPNWKANLTAWGHDIYTKAHAMGFTVFGPSFVSNNDAQAMGDQSAYLDFANLHDYAGANPPDPQTTVIGNEQGQQPLPGSKSFVATEYGWQVPDWATEAQQAERTLRQYLMHERLGVGTSYLYELYDDNQHFGLYRSDHSLRPAGVAVQNLLTLVPDVAVANPQPMTFGFSDGEDLSGVEYLDVDLGNGTHDIILWRDGSPTDQRTLQLGCATSNDVCGTFEWADPVASATFFKEGSQTVHLGADPLVVHLGP